MAADVRERIAAALREVAQADPSIATRLAATGQIVNIRGPAEFAAGIAEQRVKLAELAKTLGIKGAQ
jgi:tripartite-type tricarboxylate transporter receptor subunit TctC